MGTLNGKFAQAAEAHNLEQSLTLSTEKESKVRRDRQNPVTSIQLHLDAGSSRTKFVANEWVGSYPSVFKEVAGELPSGVLGCFSIGGKNYAVGRVASSLNGTVIEAFRDNKIKFLNIWLIGALANHPDLLSSIAEERKYRGKPARLKINLRLLSLSSSKKNDIFKILAGTKTFIYEGVSFEIEIVTGKNYLLPEGYGASLVAMHQIPPSCQEFHILDLGGGTLTFSTYLAGREPRAVEQTPGSGNGMKAIIERLCIALGRTDRGGVQFKKDGIESCLRNSKPIGDGKHSVKYRHGTEILEIGCEVNNALSEWVAEMPMVETLLSKASQALLNGSPVFATGGGMAISAIADWVQRYCCVDIAEPQFHILPNAQDVNITGLRHLDP
jgi:hypothetical protein